MDTLQIVLLSVCSVLAIIFIAIRAKFGGLGAFLLKTLASFGLVASAFVSIAYSNIDSNIRIVLSLLGIGLLLGMIGDMVLDLKVVYNNDRVYLNSGMLSFGLGHLAYFSAFSLYAINLNCDLLMPILVSAGSAIVLTIAIVLSSKKMHLDFGNFLWQTVAYTFILTFMSAYALVLAILGGAPWLAFIGMILFFLSDIVLSLQYFGGKLQNKWLIVINHTLYYAAQIILLAVLMTL